MKKMIFPFLLLVFVLVSFHNWKEDAAVQFLKSLDSAQLKKAQLSFTDLTRNDWHFLPGSMWPRPGVQLGELDDQQKELLFQLLQVYLSETGYAKTQRIIGLEDVLKDLGGNPEMRDPEKYNVTFYGQPAKDSLWAWSFEGHHISLNFTVWNDQISMTPRFFGANPATIPSGPRKGERTLALEEDLAYDLINSMTSEQRKNAVFQQRAFRDIVTSNASKVSPLKQVGIRLQDLSEAQQKSLLDLINEYLASMPEPLAQKRSQQLQTEELDEIRFAWAGSTKVGDPHYYRIQGATFLIELDNTQNNANHIHTVWRDFDGDFGRDLIREHYHHSGHH